MQSVHVHLKLVLIVAFHGAHVRVTVLTNIPRLRCDLCLRTGGCFNAAYEVLGVRVCRKHIAKVIDAASKTVQEADRRGQHADAVVRLPHRKARGRTLQEDLLRSLERIGILEIPDPNIDLDD